MYNYKMIVCYDGTRYKGWQRLGDTDNTIQGKIENILCKLTNENIEIIGSGRTDAGVHAKGQVANFKTNSKLTSKEIIDYCYEYLPRDISIKSAEEVHPRFHSRYNAVKKQYIYQFDNSTYHDIWERKYRLHVAEKLDITQMDKASKHLIGEHDFKSFTSLKSKKKSTIRHIHSISFNTYDQSIDIIFEGNGFLQHMIRIIAGTLIEVGTGIRKAETMPYILDAKNRLKSGITLPPHGLFLYKVFY